MSDFFSQLTGFNPKYAETNSAKQIDDTEDTDYSDVDFCQGDINTKNGNEGIFASQYNSELEFFEEDYNDTIEFDTEG